VFSQSKSDCN